MSTTYLRCKHLCLIRTEKHNKGGLQQPASCRHVTLQLARLALTLQYRIVVKGFNILIKEIQTDQVSLVLGSTTAGGWRSTLMTYHDPTSAHNGEITGQWI